MDFNLNDERELFVAIRELMASENWEAYFAECDRTAASTLSVCKRWRIWVLIAC